MIRSAFAFIALITVVACESLATEPVTPDLEEGAVTAAQAAQAADVVLKNGSMEDTTSWYFRAPSGMSAGYAKGSGVNGTHGAQLTGSGTSAADAFAFAGQTVFVDDLTGRQLTLRAKLRLVDVKGAGVAIALRGDDQWSGSGAAEAFSTTQARVSIRGTSEWTEYGVSLQDLDVGIGLITAYVILLPGTTGTVYVDDVSVSSSALLPQFTLQNGGFEAGISTPDNWWTGGTTFDGFTFEWLRAGAYEGSRAARITRQETSAEHFAYWAQTFRADAFRDGPITLRARVRTDLKGQGVSLAIRGDDTRVPAGDAEAFASSQYRTPITGSSGWVEWSVRLDRLPAAMQSLTVYLIFLPGTTGTVDFDRVELAR